MAKQKKFGIHCGKIVAAFKSLLVVCLLALGGIFFGVSTGIKANIAVSEKSVTTAQEGPKITSVVKHALGEGMKANRFYAGIVDDKNEKWFLTDVGIISGTLFNKFHENSKIPFRNLNNFVYESTSEGPGIWFSTPQGAILSSLPINANSKVTTYDVTNSSILSNNVLSVAVGRNQLRWFASDKGISALYNNKWLPANYKIFYPESMFHDFPITAMVTSNDGDSLYVATEGAGITRVYRSNVDAVTGASQYAQWGPIEMPSDSVYSICITPDGTQWIGTSQGVGRHTGYITMENWTVFNTGNGLVNNHVQAIAADKYGNIWCGTKGGVSVFDGASWTSFTMKDGLISDNIVFIMTDKKGIVYLGTDSGIMIYTNGQLDCYQ